MNRRRAARVCVLLWAALPWAAPLRAETFESAAFGEVRLYRQGTPQEVVLFLSGDGGWNLGVISMAQHLAGSGALVAGIDIRHYLAHLESATEACVSPALELLNLGREVQARLDAKEAIAPTLVGYSSGATLAYAALVQSQPGEFKGALSLGFCPDLDLKKPLCAGSGIRATPRHDAKGVLKGVNFLPAPSMSGKWIVLQGQLDQVCLAAPTERFLGEVHGAELVLLPKVGHGYGVEHNWVPQYLKAFDDIIAPHTAARKRAAP